MLFLLTAAALLTPPGDTVYYDSTYARTTKIKEAVYVDYYTWPDPANGILLETGYWLKTKTEPRYLAKTTHFKVNDYGIKKDTLKHGEQVYYVKGRLNQRIQYAMNKPAGDWAWYWPNGQEKRRKTYQNGEVTAKQMWDSTGKTIGFYDMEEMPIPPADLGAYLGKTIQYPKDARKAGIQGQVVLRFRVQPDGSIDDIEVARSVYPSIDAEAVRVLSQMPKWTPGRQEGVPVAVRYTLPIRFRL